MLESIKQFFNTVSGTVSPYLELVWNAFSDYAYLQVGFVATIGYLFAKLLGHYVPDLLQKAFKNTRYPINSELKSLLHFPLFYLTFLISLLIAVQASEFSEPVSRVLVSILNSVMIGVIGLFIYKLARLLLMRIADSGDQKGIIQQRTLPLFINAVMIFVLIGASHQIFAVWEVDMTALLASAGIAGLAVGMAAQGTIADIIAGILILTDRPLNVGDVVQLDHGEQEVKGVVTFVGIRSTRILNDLNVEIVIPNAKLGNSRILNETTAADKGCGVILEVDVATGTDIDRVRHLMLDELRHHADIIQDKEHEVMLLGFNWRSMTIELATWSYESDWDGRIAAELREAIYKRLIQDEIPFALPEQEAIEIKKMADSRRELYIKEMPEQESNVYIKERPEQDNNVYIKEAPNLFGLGPVKPIDTEANLRRSTTNKPSPRKPVTVVRTES